MTSREPTSPLPRLKGTEVAGSSGRSVRDWVSLLAFGAIQWPWLLKSLSGGLPEAKQALLKRLDLPPKALPNLGSWKADVGLLTLVADHIAKAKPKVVVEFGAGASTLIVARALQMAGGGTHIALDQHPDFADSTREWLAAHNLVADLKAVPLVPSSGGWPGLWYDHGPLPDEIDLLVVDGPPWTIHPLTRGAASTLFDRIPVGGVVMLDDAARPGERVVARRWRKCWPNFSFVLDKSGTKGTLVGRRLR